MRKFQTHYRSNIPFYVDHRPTPRCSFYNLRHSEAYANTIPTQALKLGTAQPFWTLSQGCGSSKRTKQANKQTSREQAKLDKTYVAFLKSSLQFPLGTCARNSPYSSTANSALKVQDPKIFQIKTPNHSQLNINR